MEKKSIKPKAIRKSRPKIDLDIDSDSYEERHYYKDERRPRRRTDRRDTEEPMEIHHHYYYEPPKKRKPSSKPRIVGALLIIVGILGLVMASIMFVGGSFVGNMGEGFGGIFGVDDNADISGRVTLANGTPVQGVNISIVDEPLSDTTDADGYYIIYNVPSGNQKIKVEKDGYITIIYKTFIEPSDSNHDRRHDNKGDKEFDFTIRPGNGEVEQGKFPPWAWFESMIYVCAIIVVILSVIVIIGATYAFKRTHFAFVLVATIAGIFTIGLVIGAILSIIALFILILARHEFKSSEENYPERL